VVEAVGDDPDHAPVPCHNDLLPANFLRGERIVIVDWEYAGMGDRFFDLGNLAVNNEYEDDDEERLLEAYFGEPATPRRRASLKLFRFMSDFREAMWGVAQGTLSELDFDFDAYASKHFERMSATSSDERFGSLLEEARGRAA
jgi:thiamine kinase-like enzyme